MCLYVLRVGPISHAGRSEDCELYGNGTTLAGYSCSQLQALPISYALVSGICTILMGLVAGVPFTVGPGLFSAAFQRAAIVTGSPQNILAGNIIVGLLVLIFGITFKLTRAVRTFPEDYRLGLAAGIGGLLAMIGAQSMRIVSPRTATFVAAFSYRTILGLIGVVLILLMTSLGEPYASFSFIVSILSITIVSVIIRASTDRPILPPGYQSGVASLGPLVENLPSFDLWASNDFVIFEYIVHQSLVKFFDLTATISALILLGV